MGWLENMDTVLANVELFIWWRPPASLHMRISSTYPTRDSAKKARPVKAGSLQSSLCYRSTSLVINHGHCHMIFWDGQEIVRYYPYSINFAIIAKWQLYIIMHE